ncbi:protein grainyhead isoform X1 [Octopus bimaculoides]|uniref:Grh/CP2 DB domain-containing protein n=1 Tax=Octopus bimaculoides TaxID=37653 RepID=A0A0L8HFS5_OCTBM|nr:protein grainyhead isoform X1 [Octopus bimaculoides]
MENTKKEKHIKNITVTTLILVNFREPMSLEKNLIAWELWSDRQHSTKTRILDIDTKNGQGILSNSIEELSHNAVSVKWKPSETPSLVNIAINCLSTDFSNQKGVKGIPLHIQVDTYEGEDRYPVHRGYCQVKIFCDKGAERKTRDEERRRTAKVKTENSNSPTHSPPLDGENDLFVPTLLGRKRSEEVYHQTCERSEFYSMQDLTTEPQLFNPLGDIDDYRVRKHGIVHYSLNEEERVGNSISNNKNNTNLDENRDGFPPAKVPRRNNFLYCMTYQKVMLYVREQTESTFTALLLRTPTVEGLLRAVEEKYEIPASKVKNTYKRSKKGVLIKMDNNIIQHYAHETTFIIEKCRTADDKGYEIILTEIDP